MGEDFDLPSPAHRLFEPGIRSATFVFYLHMTGNRHLARRCTALKVFIHNQLEYEHAFIATTKKCQGTM